MPPLKRSAATELSREVLPQMRAQKSGHILNLTSIAGMVAFPGNGLYNASKFALEGFTEALHMRSSRSVSA